MDDFERDLSRLMRDTRQHAPYEPEHRQRLHAGIRARRRSRMLWKAGGSAVAVAGLSVGLALLPQMGSRAQPAEPRPQRTTSPAPTVEPSPTTGAPGPSVTPTRPESTAPATTAGSDAPQAGTTMPVDPTPTRTVAESHAASGPPDTAPPSSPSGTVPPSVPESRTPSASSSVE
ncbi:cellulase [Streptomyces sp. NPDC017943]|uniref:cellulase n=1 Tax=Streptomyces sp. NPDC017943 TaxID=3365019 RepID=UPI0037AFBD41